MELDLLDPFSIQQAGSDDPWIVWRASAESIAQIQQGLKLDLEEELLSLLDGRDIELTM